MPPDRPDHEFFALPKVDHLSRYIRLAIEKHVSSRSPLYVASMIWPEHKLEASHKNRSHVVALGVVSWTGHLLAGVAADISIEEYRSMANARTQSDKGLPLAHYVVSDRHDLESRFALGRCLQTWLQDHSSVQVSSAGDFVDDVVGTGVANFADMRSPGLVFEPSMASATITGVLNERIAHASVLHLERTTMPAGLPEIESLGLRLRPFAYVPCPEDEETWQLAMLLDRDYPGVAVLYAEALATVDASPASAMVRLRTMAERIAQEEISRAEKKPKDNLSSMIEQLNQVVRNIVQNSSRATLDRLTISRVSMTVEALERLRLMGNDVHNVDSANSENVADAFQVSAELLRTLADNNPLARSSRNDDCAS